jgi:hypothetical protein
MMVHGTEDTEMGSDQKAGSTDLSEIIVKHSKRGNGSYYEISAGETKAKIHQTTITRISNNLAERVRENREPADLEDYLFDYFPPAFRLALEDIRVSQFEAYQFMAHQPQPIRRKATNPAMELAVIIAKGIPRRIKVNGKDTFRTGTQQIEVLISLLGGPMNEVETLLDEWAKPDRHGINARGYINVQVPKPVIKKPVSKRSHKAEPE